MGARERKKGTFKIYLLFLLIFNATSDSNATNIDCGGKAFHCLNTTNFMICVDQGNGVAMTLEDISLPCPPGTECHPDNIFECEFPRFIPVMNILAIESVTENSPVKSQDEVLISSQLDNDSVLDNYFVTGILVSTDTNTPAVTEQNNETIIATTDSVPMSSGISSTASVAKDSSAVNNVDVLVTTAFYDINLGTEAVTMNTLSDLTVNPSIVYIRNNEFSESLSTESAIGATIRTGNIVSELKSSTEQPSHTFTDVFQSMDVAITENISSSSKATMIENFNTPPLKNEITMKSSSSPNISINDTNFINKNMTNDILENIKTDITETFSELKKTIVTETLDSSNNISQNSVITSAGTTQMNVMIDEVVVTESTSRFSSLPNITHNLDKDVTQTVLRNINTNTTDNISIFTDVTMTTTQKYFDENYVTNIFYDPNKELIDTNFDIQQSYTTKNIQLLDKVTITENSYPNKISTDVTSQPDENFTNIKFENNNVGTLQNSSNWDQTTMSANLNSSNNSIDIEYQSNKEFMFNYSDSVKTDPPLYNLILDTVMTTENVHKVNVDISSQPDSGFTVSEYGKVIVDTTNRDPVIEKEIFKENEVTFNVTNQSDANQTANVPRSNITDLSVNYLPSDKNFTQGALLFDKELANVIPFNSNETTTIINQPDSSLTKNVLETVSDNTTESTLIKNKAKGLGDTDSLEISKNTSKVDNNLKFEVIENVDTTEPISTLDKRASDDGFIYDVYANVNFTTDNNMMTDKTTVEDKSFDVTGSSTQSQYQMTVSATDQIEQTLLNYPSDQISTLETENTVKVDEKVEIAVTESFYGGTNAITTASLLQNFPVNSITQPVNFDIGEHIENPYFPKKITNGTTQSGMDLKSNNLNNNNIVTTQPISVQSKVTVTEGYYNTEKAFYSTSQTNREIDNAYINIKKNDLVLNNTTTTIGKEIAIENVQSLNFSTDATSRTIIELMDNILEEVNSYTTEKNSIVDRGTETDMKSSIITTNKPEKHLVDNSSASVNHNATINILPLNKTMIENYYDTKSAINSTKNSEMGAIDNISEGFNFITTESTLIANEIAKTDYIYNKSPVSTTSQSEKDLVNIVLESVNNHTVTTNRLEQDLASTLLENVNTHKTGNGLIELQTSKNINVIKSLGNATSQTEEDQANSTEKVVDNGITITTTTQSGQRASNTFLKNVDIITTENISVFDNTQVTDQPYDTKNSIIITSQLEIGTANNVLETNISVPDLALTNQILAVNEKTHKSGSLPDVTSQTEPIATLYPPENVYTNGNEILPLENTENNAISHAFISTTTKSEKDMVEEVLATIDNAVTESIMQLDKTTTIENFYDNISTLSQSAKGLANDGSVTVQTAKNKDILTLNNTLITENPYDSSRSINVVIQSEESQLNNVSKNANNGSTKTITVQKPQNNFDLINLGISTQSNRDFIDSVSEHSQQSSTFVDNVLINKPIDLRGSNYIEKQPDYTLLYNDSDYVTVKNTQDNSEVENKIVTKNPSALFDLRNVTKQPNKELVGNIFENIYIDQKEVNTFFDKIATTQKPSDSQTTTKVINQSERLNTINVFLPPSTKAKATDDSYGSTLYINIDSRMSTDHYLRTTQNPIGTHLSDVTSQLYETFSNTESEINTTMSVSPSEKVIPINYTNKVMVPTSVSTQFNEVSMGSEFGDVMSSTPLKDLFAVNAQSTAYPSGLYTNSMKVDVNERNISVLLPQVVKENIGETTSAPTLHSNILQTVINFNKKDSSPKVVMDSINFADSTNAIPFRNQTQSITESNVNKGSQSIINKESILIHKETNVPSDIRNQNIFIPEVALTNYQSITERNSNESNQSTINKESILIHKETNVPSAMRNQNTSITEVPLINHNISKDVNTNYKNTTITTHGFEKGYPNNEQKYIVKINTSLVNKNKSEDGASLGITLGNNNHSKTSTNKDNISNFTCNQRKRGRYGDSINCSKFYICIGRKDPIVGRCPSNTVFSASKTLCTKNLSECAQNREFECTSEGRFLDYLIRDIYYICVKSKNIENHYVRFKFNCESGYYLNTDIIKCIHYETNSSDSHVASIDESSKSDRSENNNSDITKTKEKKKLKKSKNDKKESKERLSNSDDYSDNVFKCSKEGKFVDPRDCRKYYECKEHKKSVFRRKRRTCKKGDVFNEKKKKCVDSESSECY